MAAGFTYGTIHLDLQGWEYQNSTGVGAREWTGYGEAPAMCVGPVSPSLNFCNFSFKRKVDETRMYDPAVGRMLSPDIIIQQEHNSQAYNRYSYCFNNPLRFTDPSGYVVDIPPELRQIGNLALKYYENPTRRLAKQLEQYGVDIQSISVEYNTELSQNGLEGKTVSWNSIEQPEEGSRHYLDILKYKFPSLNWGKPEGQHYKLGCLAFGLVQQEGRSPEGNRKITEESIMRTDYDSNESGLNVSEVMNDYFMKYTNSYKGFDFLLCPRGGSMDFGEIVFENMKNNNSVSLDLRQPVSVFGVLNHFVNVGVSYRYHVGESNHFDYDFHPWGSSASNGSLDIMNYLLMYPK